jgi:hypothetical protein
MSAYCCLADMSAEALMNLDGVRLDVRFLCDTDVAE